MSDLKKALYVLVPVLILSLVILLGPQLSSQTNGIVPFPSVPRVAASTPNEYNFSVSPGTYDSGTGNWTVPPNTVLTLNSSTNDVSVNRINMTGASQDGFEFSVDGAPSSCGSGCLYINATIQANHDVAGDTWTITCTYYTGSSHTTVRARIFPIVIVSPEFPYGTVAAIIAPLSAIGVYLFAYKRRGKPSQITSKGFQ